MKQSSYTFLGIRVDALTIPELNSLIAEAVGRNEKRIIANHNLHSCYLYHHDSKMRAFYNKAEYIYIDGMVLVLLGRLLGLPLRREQRVTPIDWIHPFMTKVVQQDWRVFYLGSKPEVAKRGAYILQEKFPGLQIATSCGYFDANPDSQGNRVVLGKIDTYQPHILMVGMGMPRQEHWVLENLEYIHANIIFTCGALLDYVAGIIPTPPRWLGRWGLEWFYRLLTEPRRLWKRYLVEPWFVFKLFLQEMWIKKV